MRERNKTELNQTKPCIQANSQSSTQSSSQSLLRIQLPHNPLPHSPLLQNPLLNTQQLRLLKNQPLKSQKCKLKKKLLFTSLFFIVTTGYAGISSAEKRSNSQDLLEKEATFKRKTNIKKSYKIGKGSPGNPQSHNKRSPNSKRSRTSHNNSLNSNHSGATTQESNKEKRSNPFYAPPTINSAQPRVHSSQFPPTQELTQYREKHAKLLEASKKQQEAHERFLEQTDGKISHVRSFINRTKHANNSDPEREAVWQAEQNLQKLEQEKKDLTDIFEEERSSQESFIKANQSIIDLLKHKVRDEK